jgi:hypothetical protein
MIGRIRSVCAGVLVLAAGACRAPLHFPNADAQGFLPSGGTDRTDLGEVREIPADPVRVCTYTASGQDLAVTVFRNKDRTTFTLISKLFASPIIQAIGEESDVLFAHEIEHNHTLSARVLANGLLTFADIRLDPSGPGWAFDSTCSDDGIQIRNVPRDASLHVEIVRPDDTTYHVDLPESWNLGSTTIHFYAGAEGTPSTTELDTQVEVVTRNLDGSAHLAFTDLDGRRVGIDITSYGILTAVRIESP